MSKRELKIVIIEDNKIIRDGLKLLIDQSANHKCKAAYKESKTFLKNYNHLQADIILIDIGLQDPSGIESIKRIKGIDSDSLILALTVYGEDELMFEAIKAGAAGCLLKNTIPSQMIKILNEISNGKTLMSAFIATKIVKYFNSTRLNIKTKAKKKLAKKESKVLAGLIDGNSLTVIADSLDLTISDVKKIYFNIYKKIHVAVI